MAQTVGQYELLRRIGSGGMAEVWMGRRAGVGGAHKSVAIKLMTPSTEGDARHRRMFVDEARLSMLMTHSNVVQVFDAGEEGGRLYLVMEWVDGLNLAQLCALRRNERRPWPPLLAGYIIGEVLRGLAYAHRLSHDGQELCVVHRDVSPHNVLISTSGEVKLADFGVARLATEETSGLHVKGKLRYMAPEQLGGRSREPTVDLYGAGAVLHELLEGARFRDQVDEVDLYGLILGGRIPPLTVEGLPPELVSLRLGLLQSEPRQRIGTAERALEYLRAWRDYRNAAPELGQLCRGYMGITGPRSSISMATPRAVDVLADTALPEAATRTSAAQPAATSLRSPSGATTLAGVEPPPSRRALLVGLGITVAGFAAGGIGVAMMNSNDEPESEPDPESGLDDGSPVDDVPLVAGATIEQGTTDTDALVSGTAGDGTTMSADRSADTEADTGGETSTPAHVGSTGDPSSTATDGPASSKVRRTSRRKPKTAGPSGRATVEFRVRRPLRLAYARFGSGAAFAVDPVTTRTVSAGRSMVMWKAADGPVWVEGKTFDFRAGGHYVVRLTTQGPVLESSSD